jgi:hypothetical protein
MPLFDYQAGKEKQEQAETFTGTDEQVRALILDMSEQSATVDDNDVKTEGNAQGFEASGPLVDQGIEIGADVIVQIGDKLISNIFAKYALDDPEKFYADDDDLKNVSKPLEVYFKENKTNIPPWAVALFSAAMILFQKATLAKMLREKNIENKKQAQQIESLQRELEILKTSKQIKDLKEEISSINSEA